MKVISVASVKGGVGKTTTITMLGHYAAERGIRTLLIDADVQASLTVSFFDVIVDVEKYDTTYDLMDGKDLVTPVVLKDNLSIVPADAYLSRLSEAKDLTILMSLKRRITEQFTNTFDLVLIDTPGSTSSILGSSLCASNHVFSPIELQKYSLRAFNEVMELISSVRTSVNMGLVFEGFLPNRVRGIRINEDSGEREPINPKQRDVLNELKDAGDILGMFGLRNAISDADSGNSINKARGRGSEVAREEISSFSKELLQRAGFSNI